MAMRTTAAPRGRRPRGCRSTTSPWRSCVSAPQTSRPSASWKYLLQRRCVDRLPILQCLLLERIVGDLLDLATAIVPGEARLAQDVALQGAQQFGAARA